MRMKNKHEPCNFFMFYISILYFLNLYLYYNLKSNLIQLNYKKLQLKEKKVWKVKNS